MKHGILCQLQRSMFCNSAFERIAAVVYQDHRVELPYTGVKAALVDIHHHPKYTFCGRQTS